MAEYIIQGNTIRYIADIVRQVRNITDDICIDEVGLHILAAVPENQYGVTNVIRTSEEKSSTKTYNIAGFKNGVYASETGDGLDAECVCTGYIPYAWNSLNPIYIKGAQITNASHIRFYGWINKTSISGNGYVNGSNISTHMNVETLGDNYYKVTPLKTLPDITHVRISLIGTGENLIISINEPIKGAENNTPIINWIPKSINSNKTDYVGDNGEDGYRVGYRVNSSGVEVADSYGTLRVTGFIPAKAGDTVYLSGIQTTTVSGQNSPYISFFDENFELVASGWSGSISNIGYISRFPSGYSSTEYANTVNITHFKILSSGNETYGDIASRIRYIRISSYTLDNNSIITINQPINT